MTEMRVRLILHATYTPENTVCVMQIYMYVCTCTSVFQILARSLLIGARVGMKVNWVMSWTGTLVYMSVRVHVYTCTCECVHCMFQMLGLLCVCTTHVCSIWNWEVSPACRPPFCFSENGLYILQWGPLQNTLKWGHIWLYQIPS